MKRSQLRDIIKEELSLLKLKKAVVVYNRLLTENDEWWTKLSSKEQANYLRQHPQSQKAKELKKDKLQKQNTNPEHIKLKELIPGVNIGTESDIHKISSKAKQKVSMLIDKLAEATKLAKEKGEKAPDFDLCTITIKGTNLFCEDNLGIPRAEMPQFKGYARPGSLAEKLPKSKSGEVDTEEVFKKMLENKNIKVSEPTSFPSDQLKATQKQLVGSKVAGMTKALESDPDFPGINAPIYVSRDGYVLDGHHRWAAVTSAAMKSGKPANMNVRVVDMDGPELVKLANQFSNEIGIEQKKATSTNEIKRR